MVASPGTRYRPNHARIKHLLALTVALPLIVFLRVFYIQGPRQDYFLTTVADLIKSRAHTAAPLPGAILARTGDPLADSLLLHALVANPVAMAENKESFEGVARQLAPLIHRPYEEILSALRRRQDKKYLVLQRWLTPDTVAAIEALEVKGLSLESEWKREYPQGAMACQSLGGRDKFHRALAGLEYRYRLVLDGQKGVKARGAAAPGLGGDFGEEVEVSAVPGRDLMLTIEPDLQRQVETELDALWDRETPRSASCLVMDPRTGEVLAVSARPNYDPNDYVTGEPIPGHRWTPVPTQFTCNIPISTQPEQGSTFKVLLMTAALERNAVTPSTTFNCPGHIDVGGQPIQCWGRYAAHGHGRLSVTDTVVYSCNICAAQVALKLGAQAYHDFLQSAGIGRDPQAGFPGEALGFVLPVSRMRRRDLATMAFGQGVSCSALQLVSAISGVVNGGVMMRPHILAAVLNKDGSVYRQVPVEAERRLCSSNTSATVREMLRQVVERGTGRTAQIPGFSVGGKTGTAQAWDPALHAFSPSRFMVSFILVAPIDRPRYVVYVSCDEPHVGRHGADVAGPVAKRIAEYALRHLDHGVATGP